MGSFIFTKNNCDEILHNILPILYEVYSCLILNPINTPTRMKSQWRNQKRHWDQSQTCFMSVLQQPSWTKKQSCFESHSKASNDQWSTANIDQWRTANILLESTRRNCYAINSPFVFFWKGSCYSTIRFLQRLWHLSGSNLAKLT